MSGRAVTLSPEHQQLAERVGFDASLLAALVDCRWTDLRQLTVEVVGSKGQMKKKPAAGLCFDDHRLRIDMLVSDLRVRFEPQGYLFFLTSPGVPDPPATLAVIRGADRYDMLRVMGTADLNGNRGTEDIIAVLKSWEALCEFRVTGAGRDWVEGRFRKNPTDMAAFAREVITLAPDTYGQADYEDVEAFITDMRRARSFQLWWD